MSRTPAKVRIDAWDAPLTEEQRWRAYGVFRKSSWLELAEWVEAEYGLARPSKSAIYRWAKRMRSQESAHRLDQALIARAEIGALAGTTATKDKLIGGWLAMATELGLNSDAATAERFTKMAMQLSAQQLAERDLELKEQRLTHQADAQRLAREKFEATEARLAAVQQAVTEVRQGGGLSPEALQKIEQAAGLL